MRSEINDKLKKNNDIPNYQFKNIGNNLNVNEVI